MPAKDEFYHQIKLLSFQFIVVFAPEHLYQTRSQANAVVVWLDSCRVEKKVFLSSQ